jgi:hypothetical protein
VHLVPSTGPLNPYPHAALHSLPPCLPAPTHTSHPLHFFLFTFARVSSRATSEPSLLVLHGRPLHLESSGTCSPSSSCLALQSALSAQGATRRARSWLPTAPTILLPRVLLSAERRFVPACLFNLDLKLCQVAPVPCPHPALPCLAGRPPTDALSSQILDRGDISFSQGQCRRGTRV